MLNFNTTLNNVVLNKYLFTNHIISEDKTSCRVYDISNLNDIKFIKIHSVNTEFNKINTIAFNFFKTLNNYSDIGIYLNDCEKDLYNVVLNMIKQGYKIHWKNKGYELTVEGDKIGIKYLYNDYYTILQVEEIKDCFITQEI